MRRRTCAYFVMGASCLLLACGDDGQATRGDAVSGDAKQADTTGPVEVVAFQVVDPEALNAPVSGATVTFTPPCGDALTAVSDADGAVSFAGRLDWSCGAGQIVVARENYYTFVAVGIDALAVTPPAPDAAVQLPICPCVSGGIVLSGSVEGYASIAHGLLVNTDAAETHYQGTMPRWSLTIPPDVGFNWVAVEFHQGDSAPTLGLDQVLDQAATGSGHGGHASHDLSIDFGTQSMDFQRAEISFPPVPNNEVGLAAGVPYVVVHQVRGAVTTFLGASEHLGADTLNQPAAGGVAWIAPEFATHPQTTLRWSREGFASEVRLAGYPVAGSQDVTFLVPPKITSLSRGRASAPVTWTNDEPNAVVQVRIMGSIGPFQGRTLALIQLPPGTTSVLLTDLGMPADVFSTQRQLTVTLCDLDPATQQCVRTATAAAVLVSPPL